MLEGGKVRFSETGGEMTETELPVRAALFNSPLPGGNSFGEFCCTLTVTDVCTGWTVNRSVRNKVLTPTENRARYAS